MASSHLARFLPMNWSAAAAALPFRAGGLGPISGVDDDMLPPSHFLLQEIHSALYDRPSGRAAGGIGGWIVRGLGALKTWRLPVKPPLGARIPGRHGG